MNGRLSSPHSEGLLDAANVTLEDEVGRYLAAIVSRFDGTSSLADATAPQRPRGDAGVLADEIFAILTHRQFCHLSRRRALPYRPQALERLRRCLLRGGPLPFWYDIGPGYHASVRPGEVGLSFAVGLSELLLLSQIAAFSDRVRAIYPEGVRFWLAVDNLCALRANDVPVEETIEYCNQLRSLIRELGLAGKVALLVESEQVELDQYDHVLDQHDAPLPLVPSDETIANVERFLGRRCGPEEAVERVRMYQRASAASDDLLGKTISGVHLTQRATDLTLGFRSFAGGDSRAQCGEVAITRNRSGRLRPTLLTSSNVDSHLCVRLDLAAPLSAVLAHVTYAERLDGESTAGRAPRKYE